MIYDNEVFWEMVPTKSATKAVYRHTELEGVYRILDYANHTIEFSDVNRISVIHDINKMLVKEDDPVVNMKKYLPIVNELLDKNHPISFPYMRSDHIAYIEAFPGDNSNEDNVLGILYVRDKGLTENNDQMIAIKTFYKILPIASVCRFEEIDMDTYNELKINYFRRLRKNVGENDTGNTG